MKPTDFINENAEDLNIGDPVIITGNVQFKGKTGDIVDFGKDKRFVVVNLYNYGKHSFHSSDVSYNDYAESGDEQEYLSQFEESKPSTIFVGQLKGTDPASLARDRLVGEAKSLQSKFEKHLAKHGYDVAEKSKYWGKKLKDIDAQIAAWDAEMERRKQGKDTQTEDASQDFQVGDQVKFLYMQKPEIWRDGQVVGFGRGGMVYVKGERNEYSVHPNLLKKADQGITESTEQAIQKKIQAKQDALGLAKERRRAKGERQQGQREIKLQAEIDKLRNELAQLKKQDVAESTSVTDYNPKSQGGTRKELLAKYHKTKDPKDAEAARRAGATQKELQGVAEGLPGSLSKSDYMPGAVRHDLSNIKSKKQEPQRDMPVADIDPDWEKEQAAKRKKQSAADTRKRSLQATRDFNRSKASGMMEQGVAEGFLGDREYNRVMPFVKRIASEVSDYDRDEFGEELWSLLDQKYGPKFAQSVLDDIDFYWDTYTELTDQQGVAEAVMRGGDEDYPGDPDYEDRDNEDEGFFVAIGNEEDGMFLGMVTRDGGRWREVAISGNPPYNWGGANYMSYLSPQDVKQWINRDYGRYNQVEFFDSEEEARDYVSMMSEGVAESGEWDEYTGGNPFPDSDELDTYSGEHDLDESSGIEYRGFDIRTSRDYITGEVVYWIYYRGRCTEHGNLTLDGAKKDIDYMIAAGFFNDPDEAARKKQQGLAEGSEQSFKVTYDIYGSNKEKPLYTKSRTVKANSEQEAINILRKLVGGTNYRVEKQGVAEAFPNRNAGSTGTSKEDKRIAAALRKKHMPAKKKPAEQALNIGDSVIITGNSAFEGIPGRVIGFKEGKVVVDLAEHGKWRFVPERVKLYSLDNQGVAEGAKWRNHPDAHDINDDGDIYPKTRDMFAYDPLTRRQSTAGDARTARGKKSALKTSLKMAQGRHGPKSQLPEQQGVAEGEYDDPRWEPGEPDMSRKVDWDIEAERNRPEEPGVAMTVTVRDAEGNVVLQFPSTGEYYGDLKYAAKKGFDIEGDEYHANWQRNEDAVMSEDSGATSEQVAAEIVRRIIFKHKDAISAYGPEAIMAAAREVGEFFAGADELGTSDVSIATKYTLEKLDQMSRGALGESASAGATSAGAIATTPAGGAGKNVGSLFGGTYKQKRTKKSPGTK